MALVLARSRAATALPSPIRAQYQRDVSTKLAGSSGEIVVIIRVRTFARVAARGTSNGIDTICEGLHASRHERRVSFARLAVSIHAVANVRVDIGNIKILIVRGSDLKLSHGLRWLRVEVRVLVSKQLGATTAAISGLGVDGNRHGRRGCDS